ncbi:DDE-type integrase/transposase/recombinase [Sandaracinus amylolyticus]|uniref:DDE-type integrase/transposase/recombinase n=1 Tax=Sandaracinus amylolyticus TaxID=927083 RepID=UPI001F1A1302|nr:DDE-type integrase/transposase/recombinase [Sandaracinus amylolyticus]
MVRLSGATAGRDHASASIPPTAKIGVRASAPSEWWHVDVTIVRLLDGTRAYVHAVPDNYSRKVLAWAVEPELRAATTRAILAMARERVATGLRVRVMTDGGSENVIIGTDSDLSAVAEHVVAQVGIHFSNSMIEAFWRVLRHQWLYLHSLDSIGTLRRLVSEYIHEHNAVIPHIELGGRTPDEAYAGRELDVRARLASAHADARRARVAANRAVSCAACATPPPARSSGP